MEGSLELREELKRELETSSTFRLLEARWKRLYLQHQSARTNPMPSLSLKRFGKKLIPDHLLLSTLPSVR